MSLFRKRAAPQGTGGPPKGRSDRRAVLVGLDGTPYTLVRRFIADGTMPNLASLVGRGTLVQMDSSIPPVSSVAWTSFMTGCNPAKHGVFGFMDLKPQSYSIYFPNATHVQAPTLWDVLAGHGKRSIVINQPSTYPARPLNGILVAGFVAIDLKKATYPPSILPYLERAGYRIDVDTDNARERTDAFIEDLLRTHEARAQAILHFLDTEKWDYFEAVVTGTDRLHHFLWEAVDEPQRRYHGAFVEYYRRVDALIGQIADRLDERTTILLMSDHGFTRLRKEVFINRWLQENGLLAFDDGAEPSLEKIAPSSLAFALDPSRLYPNVKGRYPRGRIGSEAETRGVVDDIAARLAAWKDPESGAAVVASVPRAEEVYRGPLFDRAPALVPISTYGYDFKGSVKRAVVFDKGEFSGMHTYDDAFLLIGQRGAGEGRRPSVADVMPTILRLMDLRVPLDVDGHNLV